MITRLKIRSLRRLFARHRFLLYVEAAVFWLLGITAVYFLFGYFVVPSIAEDRIRQFCSGEVSIQSGRFKGISGISLKGVTIAENAEKLTDAPILLADTVEVQFEPLKLLRGRFTVSSVLLSSFLFTADYDAERNHWNLTELSIQSSDKSKQVHIPLIVLQQGALRVRDVHTHLSKTLGTISISGKIAEQTGRNEFGFALKTDRRFGFGPSQLEGGLRVGSKDAQNQFWLTGNIQMPAAGILQNQWNLHEIQLDCTFDDQLVVLRRLNFSLGQGQGAIKGQIHRTEDRRLDLDVRLEDFSLSEQMQPDTIAYGQLHKYLDPGLNRFLKRYHPSGTADVEMTIDGQLKDLSQARLNGVIRCKDVSVQDRRFPYLINHMKGDIEFDGRNLRLAGLNAYHEGVLLHIEGTVHDFGPHAEIDLLTTSPNMRLDDDFYHGLSAPGRDPNEAKMWYLVSPKGLTEFEYHFQKFADGNKTQRIEMNLINVSAIYKHFRYPLENMTGSIVIESNRIKLTELLSKYDNNTQIEINGEIFHYNTPQRNFEIICRGTNIPVDQQLIDAFPQQEKAFFKGLDIDAATDFNVRIFPGLNKNARPEYIAKVEVRGEELEFTEFPLPMTEIDLSAIITRGLVRVNRFDAQTESGRIHFNECTLLPQGKDPNRPGFCLDLDLHQFELNDAFWQAVGPDAEEMLGKLRMEGAVDTTGQLNINLSQQDCMPNNLTIDCNDNPIRWDTIKLGRIDGRFTVKDCNVIFSGFELKDIPLESIPQDLLNEKAQTVFTAVSPKGLARIRIPDGFMRMSPKALTRIDLRAAIDSQDLTIGHTEMIQRLGGICEGDFLVDNELGLWRILAHYDIDQFLYRNWHVSRLAGDLIYDPDTNILHSNDFTAQLYDGTVIGNLEVDLSEKLLYQLEFNFSDIGLSLLPVFSGKEAAHEQTDKGITSGRLVLIGNLENLSDPRGKFNATAVNLEMGRQSLLGKILTAVQFKRPEDFVFHEIELNAEILGPELIFDRVRIIGNPLVFDGGGTINRESRQIAIDLTAWDRIDTDNEGLLDKIARGIGSALWKVQIQGSIEEPQVDAVYLSILKQPLDIFKKKEE